MLGVIQETLSIFEFLKLQNYNITMFKCTPVASNNKTDSHDITEILLKVALNTITSLSPSSLSCIWWVNCFYLISLWYIAEILLKVVLNTKNEIKSNLTFWLKIPRTGLNWHWTTHKITASIKILVVLWIMATAYTEWDDNMDGHYIYVIWLCRRSYHTYLFSIKFFFNHTQSKYS